MKKLFLALAFAAATFMVSAAYPSNFNKRATDLAISPTAGCNKGSESFKGFFKKFRADKAFRKQRLRLDAAYYRRQGFDGVDSWQAEQVNYIEDYGKLMVGTHRTRCSKEFGTFYDVSVDEVSYAWVSDYICDDGGGSGAYLTFRRINGKWYCIFISMAG